MIRVMREHDALPPGTPVELREAITRLGATADRVEHEARRTYLWLETATERLFARYSDDPADIAVFAHEAQARAVVGSHGTLRSPRVIERGDTWMLEERIDPLPLAGTAAIGVAIEAAGAIAGLSIPEAPEARPESRPARAVRRLRLLSAPRLAPDLLRATAVRRDVRLPQVTIHGDFHPGNLLLAPGCVYVVDWELAGTGPAGYDLLQLWASLPGSDDRDHVFEATVGLVGEHFRRELAGLRYALLVQTIAAKVATALPVSRDRIGARRLLRLLPGVRSAAFDHAG